MRAPNIATLVPNVVSHQGVSQLRCAEATHMAANAHLSPIANETTMRLMANVPRALAAAAVHAGECLALLASTVSHSFTATVACQQQEVVRARRTPAPMAKHACPEPSFALPRLAHNTSACQVVVAVATTVKQTRNTPLAPARHVGRIRARTLDPGLPRCAPRIANRGAVAKRVTNATSAADANAHAM